nr:hypothetical protein [uncultured Psychroserpens sp.]
MRNYHVIFLAVLLFSCSTKKNYTTDLEKMGLNGKIKSLKFDHDRSNVERENEDSYFIENEFNFNRKGFISEQRQYSIKGLIHVHEFNYDKNNLLISKIYLDSSREFMNKSKIENILNQKGKLIKQSEYMALGNYLTDSLNLRYSVFPDQIIEFIYDINENLTQYNNYDRASSYMKEVTILDDGELAKISTIIIPDGEIFAETNYNCVKYDSNKNCRRYRVIEKDSTTSYFNLNIEYYK